LRKRAKDSNLRRRTEQIRGWSIEQLRATGQRSTDQIRDAEEVAQQEVDTFWPPPRHALQRTTIEFLSLHNCPKRGERRPRYDGRRLDCHQYHPELSGSRAAPSDEVKISSTEITLALHSIGGFSAVSKELPPRSVETEISISAVSKEGGGMNANFGDIVHCIAAEPEATFLHIGVLDSGRETAYESVVLGRLRRGHRIFQLRGALGTRIELCYLFVHVSFGEEDNMWPSARQLRIQTLAKDAYINQLEQTLERTGAIRAHESGLHPLPPGMISRSGSVVNQGVISRSGSVVNQGNFSRSGSDVNQGMTRSGSDISHLDGMGMVRPQAEGFFTQQER